MSVTNLPVRIRTLRFVKPRLKAYYPAVCGMRSLFIQRKINKEILNLVNLLIREQGYYVNPRTTIDGTFELKTNELGVLSLSIINYAFSGGAHGLTIIKSLSFNVKTGSVSSLAELFKPGSIDAPPPQNYVDRLSNIVARQIKERDLPLLNEFTSISPDQDYYIADKCLVLYFQLYELAPYAYGFPYFPISVYEIQDIVAEDSLLGRMI